MNAPFICETEADSRALMANKAFTSIMKGARESELTLVGIGSTPNENVSQNMMRYDMQNVKKLTNSNVCRDICSNFYDIYGNICNSPLCRQFVKVNLEEISNHKCVVGIAGGNHKVAFILGTLNGHYLDMLIIDKN